MPQGQKKLGKGRKARGGNSKSDSIRKKRAGQTKKGASFKSPKSKTAALRVDDSVMKSQARMTKNAEMISAGKLEQSGDRFATNVVRKIADQQRQLVSDSTKGLSSAKKKRSKKQGTTDNDEDDDNPWLKVRLSAEKELTDGGVYDTKTSGATVGTKKRERDTEETKMLSTEPKKALKKAISESESKRSSRTAAAIAFG